ncbi:protein disulfide oxidoreductase [Athalassotoga saccharophila]|uniref:protein disulfide oxidoreductase n=1 Tax=Athalassotoga saccharophila TaxID=1441386 RepID=UPI00137A6DD6|nr:thioredoxin family protein [Athalassotoga saccharophila]BBJ27620.1 glutaredoxin-related protein [Athalassotoga saccharophila]
MAALLSEEDRKYLVDLFEKELKGEVKILFFGSKRKEECEYCDLTEQILQELAETNNKITIETHDFDEDALVKKYNVEMVPAILMLDSEGNDMRIRYYGIPSGYEFSSLIEDVIATSKKGEVDLSSSTLKKLEEIKSPLKLQVFVTPTCPYCPRAVLMAHKLAMKSPNIIGEMIEANEFPDLSMQYNVSSVPHIIINEGEGEFVGALPEDAFVEQIMSVVKGV